MIRKGKTMTEKKTHSDQAVVLTNHADIATCQAKEQRKSGAIMA